MEGGLGGSLTNEQLLDYIKKQKARIKRLEKENEAFRNEKNVGKNESGREGMNPDPVIFWDMISRERPFLKNLGIAALNSFSNALSLNNSQYKSSFLKKNQAKKSFFLKWKFQTLNLKLATSLKNEEELKQKLAATEQKNVKLKALLAKTHHANQKSLEDSNALKIAQQESAQLIKGLKLQEESEKLALMEAVRVQSIENAFQHDVELAIQKAAENMICQHILGSSSASGLKRTKDLELEIDTLKNQNQVLLLEMKENKKYLEEKDAIIKQQEEFLEDNHHSIRKLSATIEELRFKLSEEQALNRDLEIELSLTLNSRSEILKKLEADTEAKISQRLHDLSMELAETKTRLEIAERNMRVNSGSSPRASKVNIREDDYKMLQEDLELSRKHNYELETSILELQQTISAMKNEIEMERLMAPQLVDSSTVTDLDDGSKSRLTNEDADLLRNVVVSLLQESKAVYQSGCDLADLTSIVFELLLYKMSSLDKLINDVDAVVDFTMGHYVQFFNLFNNGGGVLTIPNSPYYPHVNHGNDSRSYSNASLDDNMIPSESTMASPSQMISVVDVNFEAVEEQVHEKIAEISRQLAVIHRTREQFMPMTWEAASVVIASGRDICIPIPVPALDDDAMNGDKSDPTVFTNANLEWFIFGEHAHFASLSICRANDAHSNSSGALILVSLESTEDIDPGIQVEVQRGFHTIPLEESESTYHLRVINSSIWGPINISYKIRLWVKDTQEEYMLERELTQQYHYLSQQKRRLDAIIPEGRIIAQGLRRMQSRIRREVAKEQTTIRLKRDAMLAMIPDIKKKQADYEGFMRDRFVQLTSCAERACSLVDKASMSEYKSSTSNILASQLSMLQSINQQHSTDSIQNVEAVAGERTVYSCEGLLVKAADDFRLTIPLHTISTKAVSFNLHWDISMPAKVNKNMDFGFSILEKMPDGALPQLLPYQRFKSYGTTGDIEIKNRNDEDENAVHDVIILIDNSYSWYQSKRIKYTITVTPVEMSEPPSTRPIRPQQSVDEIVSNMDSSQDSLPSPSVMNATVDLMRSFYSEYLEFLKNYSTEMRMELITPQVTTFLNTEELDEISRISEQTMFFTINNGEFIQTIAENYS